MITLEILWMVTVKISMIHETYKGILMAEVIKMKYVYSREKIVLQWSHDMWMNINNGM